MENERFELQNVAIPLKWQLPASKCCKLQRKLTEQQMNKNKTKKTKYGPGVTGSVAVCPDSFFQPTVFPLKGGGEASRRSRATVWVAQNQLESYVASEHPFLHNYVLPLVACHALS
jgi:hypothetical protein